MKVCVCVCVCVSVGVGKEQIWFLSCQFCKCVQSFQCLNRIWWLMWRKQLAWTGRLWQYRFDCSYLALPPINSIQPSIFIGRLVILGCKMQNRTVAGFMWPFENIVTNYVLSYSSWRLVFKSKIVWSVISVVPATGGPLMGILNSKHFKQNFIGSTGTCDKSVPSNRYETIEKLKDWFSVSSQTSSSSLIFPSCQIMKHVFKE